MRGAVKRAEQQRGDEPKQCASLSLAQRGPKNFSSPRNSHRRKPGEVMSDSVANRFEVVNCQACGRRVARKSRQQRYCSDRCRDYEKGQRRVRKSFLSTDTRASPNPPFLLNQNKGLQGAKSGSSIPLNLLGGYRWPGAPRSIATCCAKSSEPRLAAPNQFVALRFTNPAHRAQHWGFDCLVVSENPRGLEI